MQWVCCQLTKGMQSPLPVLSRKSARSRHRGTWCRFFRTGVLQICYSCRMKKTTTTSSEDRQSDSRLRSFTQKIKNRFFLRFHMSLILLATALSGLLGSKLLLLLGMKNIVIRYPLTVLFSYLAFFLFVKLWLAYLRASHAFDEFSARESNRSSLLDLPDISFSVSEHTVEPPSFKVGGGGSGGSGASASFGSQPANVQAFVPPQSSSVPSSGSGGTGGNFFSGLFDIDDDAIILIAIALLLAAIFGSAIYLIYIAPHILSEAAFD
ncbi:MAG: hypothetical protein M0042_06785, partial [Nitrospiraceae bacterium]|nr:hypothetical protein [Nitrospiraceae bacterium]